MDITHQVSLLKDLPAVPHSQWPRHCVSSLPTSLAHTTPHTHTHTHTPHTHAHHMCTLPTPSTSSHSHTTCNLELPSCSPSHSHHFHFSHSTHTVTTSTSHTHLTQSPLPFLTLIVPGLLCAAITHCSSLSLLPAGENLVASPPVL